MLTNLQRECCASRLAFLVGILSTDEAGARLSLFAKASRVILRFILHNAMRRTFLLKFGFIVVTHHLPMSGRVSSCLVLPAINSGQARYSQACKARTWITLMDADRTWVKGLELCGSQDQDPTLARDAKRVNVGAPRNQSCWALA